LLEKLVDWGCDVEGAMDRFLDDEELYQSCLASVCEDPAFEKLGEALGEGDVLEAFEQSHSLKGILGNLGLDPMLAIAVQIVEPLRKGSVENLQPRYEALLDSKEYLKTLLAET
jgi:HPt (histidine-containing phosphotransfer) domain-containing protein